jgi:hypothetical protein
MPPPAGESLPPPDPKTNSPMPCPVLPHERSRLPSGAKRSIRLAPVVTSTLPSPATATPPTEVSWPGLEPAKPKSRRKLPSGLKTWIVCDFWSAT